MLFRVKTQRFVSKATALVYDQYHYLQVGTVFHSTEIMDYYKSPNYGYVDVHGQHVPLECLERIPNTKANLRKFAKGLL